MNDEQQRPELESDELVAYLDGELDEESGQQLARRLREDSGLRRRLHQLQQSWDMLDELPRTEAGDRFTQTTLEMVAVSAADDVQRTSWQQDWRRRLIWAGGTLGAAAFLLAGYLTVNALVSAGNQRLLEDLPVIENVDAYRHAESVEFLRAMAENDLFTREDQDNAL